MAMSVDGSEGMDLATLRKRHQRDINCLGDPDRRTRKEALLRLKKDVFDFLIQQQHDTQQGMECDAKIKIKFFQHDLAKPLVRLLADETEKCREISAEILLDVVDKVFPALDTNTVNVLVTDVVNLSSDRMGEIPYPEESEEIRIELLLLLTKLVRNPLSRASVNKEAGKIVHVLSKTLRDKAPKSKIQSAQCIEALCASIPTSIHLYYTKLIDPMIDNLKHQRSKVRQATVEALGTVLNCAANGSGDAFNKIMQEKVLDTFHRLIHDGNSGVRTSLVKQVANLNLILYNDHDRATYIHELVLVLVAGLADALPDVQNYSLQVLETLALQTFEENKDVQSFVGRVDYDEKEFAMNVQLYEPFKKRPSIELRCLLAHWMKRVLSSLLPKVSDWTADGRIHALGSLRCTFICLEDRLNDHLDKIIPVLCEALRDDEPKTRGLAMDCSKLVGKYCNLEAILEALKSRCTGTLKGQEDSAGMRIGGLRMLSATTIGVREESMTDENFQMISDILLQTMLQGEVETESFMGQLLRATQDLVRKCDRAKSRRHADLKDSLQRCLWVLLYICNLHGNEDMQDISRAASNTVDAVARAGGFERTEELYEACLASMLDQILGSPDGCKSWSKYSPDRIVFDQMCRRAGIFVIARTKQNKRVVDVLVETAPVECDPELRLCMLSLLESLLRDLEDRDQGSETLSSVTLVEYSQILVTKMLLPNLTWRVGRVASTIRKVSVFCLCTLLKAISAFDSFDVEWLVDSNPNTIVPVLRSCLDDFDADTRKYTCVCMYFIFDLLAPNQRLDSDLARDMYHDLVKRLDDANDDVRLQACAALQRFCYATTPGALSGTAADYITDACFVHLDDEKQSIQEAVYMVLEAMCNLDIDRESILKKATKERTRHRSPEWCDKLLDLGQ